MRPTTAYGAVLRCHPKEIDALHERQRKPARSLVLAASSRTALVWLEQEQHPPACPGGVRALVGPTAAVLADTAATPPDRSVWIQARAAPATRAEAAAMARALYETGGPVRLIWDGEWMAALGEAGAVSAVAATLGLRGSPRPVLPASGWRSSTPRGMKPRRHPQARPDPADNRRRELLEVTLPRMRAATREIIDDLAVLAPQSAELRRAGLASTLREARLLAHSTLAQRELSLSVAAQERELETQLEDLRALMQYSRPPLPARLRPLEAALDVYAHDAWLRLDGHGDVAVLLGDSVEARSLAASETLVTFPHRLADRAGSWPLITLALAERQMGALARRDAEKWIRAAVEVAGMELGYTLQRFGIPGRQEAEHRALAAFEAVGAETSRGGGDAEEPDDAVARVRAMVRAARDGGAYVNETALVLDLAATPRRSAATT